MEETRQARHDLRQHLQVIQGYLDHGDRDTLKDYLAAYGKNLPLDTGQTYCANYAVDLVVRYYGEEAKQAGIDFVSRISLPAELPISEPEFCALLGNLLENAVEACRRLNDVVPFIRLACDIHRRSLILTVDNTCLEPPEESHGQLLSSKHQGYGIGTQSVHSIAARYCGTAQFTCENREFHASVLLQIPQ